jgi:hypothetical protein
VTIDWSRIVSGFPFFERGIEEITILERDVSIITCSIAGDGLNRKNSSRKVFSISAGFFRKFSGSDFKQIRGKVYFNDRCWTVLIER